MSELVIPVVAKRALAAAKAAPDMTCRQVAILAIIDANPDKSTGDVAKAAGVSRPAVTRATQKMVELGLVTSLRSKEDERRVRLFVTQRGHALLTKIGA